jgi:hypothetical protein
MTFMTDEINPEKRERHVMNDFQTTHAGMFDVDFSKRARRQAFVSKGHFAC